MSTDSISTDRNSQNSAPGRYSRQERFAPIGAAGQAKLALSSVLICGCGALGSVIAGTLARAGVGRLKIVDRDVVELTNLQRQVLFEESDAESGAPKAVAAAEKLRRINSQITIEPFVSDLNHHNILDFVDGVDLILDGTDNFETRFLINDAAVSRRIPWVYGGCIGASGQTQTILPGETPCLRCLIPEPPPPGASETCDTAGILAPIIQVIASIECTEALKILTGNRASVSRGLVVVDLWENRYRHLNLAGLQDQAECPACHAGDFPWLRGERGGHTTSLCGRNSVQIVPQEPTSLSLQTVARNLAGLGAVIATPYLVRCKLERHMLTIFPDGRAIIGGTDDIPTARTIYARYVGS